MKYTPPEHIQPTHDIESFDCGEISLNQWLKTRALNNETLGSSRTYVVCWENKVVGYYCLANGQVSHIEAPGKIKRNMPDPIPVVVMGRLAVDIHHQGKGIGMGMIKDAVKRTLQASEILGIRAILIHALNENVKDFYVERCGFMPSPIHPLTVMVKLSDIKKNLI
ncbi:MAG: GNAT family N-acetyltransferase [Coleofasciculus sp. B1-GNL1-01]|uniref:GNAT family N-acetyltransferase n=1 Tax=Coleofasciculus sp. B1-GNL1-01 TaxID=3068484 RepID=UPI0032F1050E